MEQRRHSTIESYRFRPPFHTASCEAAPLSPLSSYTTVEVKDGQVPCRFIRFFVWTFSLPLTPLFLIQRVTVIMNSEFTIEAWSADCWKGCPLSAKSMYALRHHGSKYSKYRTTTQSQQRLLLLDPFAKENARNEMGWGPVNQKPGNFPTWNMKRLTSPCSNCLTANWKKDQHRSRNEIWGSTNWINLRAPFSDLHLMYKYLPSKNSKKKFSQTKAQNGERVAFECNYKSHHCHGQSEGLTSANHQTTKHHRTKVISKAPWYFGPLAVVCCCCCSIILGSVAWFNFIPGSGRSEPSP